MGIEFKDPYTGVAYDDASFCPPFHAVLADVYLEDPLPESLPRDSLSVHIDNFLILIPLLEKTDPAAKPRSFWRLGVQLPSGQKPPR